MSDQRIYTRMVQRHGTAIDWSKATNFIPKQGEIIIYDADKEADALRGYYIEYEFPNNYIEIDGVECVIEPSATTRFKIGNGSDNVNVLPFYVGKEDVLSLSPFIVHITTNDDGTLSSDKSYYEILGASRNFGGEERPIICYLDEQLFTQSHMITDGDPIYFIWSAGGWVRQIEISEGPYNTTVVDLLDDFYSITIGSETWDLDNVEVDFTEAVNELIDNKNKLLIVSVEDGGAGYQHSHSPSTIYKHIQKGGTAVVHCESVVYQLLSCTDTYADFYTITDECIFKLLTINTVGATIYENTLALASDVKDKLDAQKPLIVTYNSSDKSATSSASEIYAHISNGSTAFLYNPEKKLLYSIGMCDETYAIFSGPVEGEWEPYVTRVYIDNDAKAEVYDTQLVCHYEFENESKPFLVNALGEGELSENYEKIVGTLKSGRPVVIRDNSGYYHYLEVYTGGNWNQIQFGAFTEDGLKRTLIVHPDSTYTVSDYQANLDSWVDDIKTVINVDSRTGNRGVSADSLFLDNKNDHSIGVSFEAGELEQLSDSSNNKVQSLELYGQSGDELVRLRRLAPGTQESDAVTLGQLSESEKNTAKKITENFPVANLLNFYDPNLINISYCNPKNLPGWQVRFKDNSVYNKSNEFFSGAEGMSEHKEITFTPATSTIDIGIQTASTAHTNSCKISNLSLVRVDGQSLGHLSTPTATFSGNDTEVVHHDTFGNTNGWSGAKGAGYGYGRLDGDGLLLETTGWNGAGNKTFTVTPGILHTVSFYYKAVRNGLNFSIYNGTSKSDTKLGGGYLSKTAWTLVSYTFTPTSNNIYITFGGSNKGTTEAPDIMYVDDFIVSKATGYTLWDGIIKNTSSNGQFSTTMDNAKKSIRMKSNWAYWNEYIKIPLTGLNPTDTYIIRFKADVTSNGVNLSGENISWITRDIFYISADGYYIASFQPSSVGTCYITFKGDGQSKDDVTISDIHIFNQNEPIGTLGIDNKRWITSGISEWQGNTHLLKGDGKTYSYGLRTLAVAVDPDVEYKLSFDVTYDKPNTYNWMPYITFTDEDKISFVTDGCIPSDELQCGGPWIGTTDSAHTLKIDIDIPEPSMHNNPTMVQFVCGGSGDTSPITADVILYSPPGNTVVKTIPYKLLTEVDYYKGDVVCQVPIESDYALSRVSIVIIPDMSYDIKGNILIKNLKLFGSRKAVDLPGYVATKLPYKNGPNKEVTFYNKVTASLFDGKIDDGYVD